MLENETAFQKTSKKHDDFFAPKEFDFDKISNSELCTFYSQIKGFLIGNISLIQCDFAIIRILTSTTHETKEIEASHQKSKIEIEIIKRFLNQHGK
jgi:hypothetical protein